MISLKYRNIRIWFCIKKATVAAVWIWTKSRVQTGASRCEEALSPFGKGGGIDQVVTVGLKRSTESQVVGFEGDGEIKGH